MYPTKITAPHVQRTCSPLQPRLTNSPPEEVYHLYLTKNEDGRDLALLRSKTVARPRLTMRTRLPSLKFFWRTSFKPQLGDRTQTCRATSQTRARSIACCHSSSEADPTTLEVLRDDWNRARSKLNKPLLDVQCLRIVETYSEARHRHLRHMLCTNQQNIVVSTSKHRITH